MVRSRKLSGARNSVSRGSERIPRWAPPVALVLGLLLYHGDIVFFGRSYFLWDLAYQFFPWRQLAGEALGQGILPLWNSFQFCGISQIGNPQTALLYPPTWLFAFFAFARALTLNVLFHQALACWGLYRLARVLGCGRGGACFGAMGWGFSGALGIRLPFLNMGAVLALLPWAVLAGLRLRRKPGPGAVVCLGLVTSLGFLAGQPREFLMLILAAGIAALVPGFRRAPWVSLAAGLGLGALLSLGQGLPFLETLSLSNRAGSLAWSEANIGGWEARHLIHWILPLRFGTPLMSDYQGPAQIWSGFGYVGLWGLILGFRGWLSWSRKYRWIGGLSVLVLLDAGLGDGSLTWEWFRSIIPFADRIRYPESSSLLVVLILSLAAAQGWDRGSYMRSRRGRIAAAALLAVGLVLAVFHHRNLERDLGSGGKARSRASLIRAGTVLALGATGPLASGLAQAVDLLELKPWISPSGPDAVYEVTPPEIHALRKVMGGERIYLTPAAEGQNRTLGDNLDMAVLGLRRRLLPNMPNVDHVFTAGGYDPLHPKRFQIFWDLIHRSGREPWLHGRFPLLASPVAVFVPRDRTWEGPQVSFRQVPAGPRARMFVPVFARDRSDAARILREGGPAEIPLEAEPGLLTSTEVDLGKIRVREDGWGRTEIFLEKAQDGWLFLSQGYDPGLRARAGGKPRLLAPAGLAFCGIRIESGDSRIVVDYVPDTFWIGFFGSCLGLGLCAGLGTWVRFRGPGTIPGRLG